MKVLKEAIVAHDGEVRECYEEALRSWLDLEGRVAMRFVIGPQGTVIGAHQVSNDTGVDALGCCIAQAMRSWTLPKPTGGGSVVVTFPYVMQSYH